LVKKILNDRQREEVADYLDDRPWVMPPYVRGIRMNAKQLDFDQMRADIDLLQTLAELDLRTGRKSNEYKDIHAKMNIRQRGSVDTKAKFTVKPK